MEPVTLILVAGAAVAAWKLLRPSPAQAAEAAAVVPIAPMTPAQAAAQAAPAPTATQGQTSVLGGQLSGEAALGGVLIGVGLSFVQDWAAARDEAAAGAAGIKALFERLRDMLSRGAFDAWLSQGMTNQEIAAQMDRELGRFSYRCKTRSGSIDVNTVSEFLFTHVVIPIPGYFGEAGPTNKTFLTSLDARRAKVMAEQAAGGA